MVDPAAQTRVVWALRRAFLKVEARKDELMRTLAVTPAQYAVLINIAVAPGVAAAELARRLQVSPQNVAVLVNGLSERGLVERRHHPRHRHVLELHLTDLGRRELDRAEQVVSRLEAEVNQWLDESSGQLRTLLERLASLPDHP